MYKLKHWLVEVLWRQKLPRIAKGIWTQAVSPAGLLVIAIFITALLSGFKLDDLFKSEANKLKEEVTFSVDKPYKLPDFRVEEWLDDSNKAQPDSPVQLIVFWNASCLSCQRVLPHIQQWSDKYDEDGLSVLGVHTPEFGFEKSKTIVQDRTQKLELTFPTAIDNDFKIADAFANKSAPALVFVDDNQKIRHVEIGEGNYSHSERVIQALLIEHNPKLRYERPQDSAADEPRLNFLQSSDMYLGYALSDAFANADDLVKDEVATYSYRSAGLSQFSIEGGWLVGKVSLKSANDAKLKIHFTAKDAYIVMGATSPTAIEVELGKGLLPGEDVVLDKMAVAEYRIYHVATAEAFASDATLTLELPPGVELYKVYFGG